ncbi:MAG: sorbitol dehydrogenase [Anaerolineae bacterium]
MKAVKLYAARDLRLEEVNDPPAPGAGDVVLRVRAVGICGSDLHMYEDGRIGDTSYDSPLVLGHEFMGEIVAIGAGALDGNHQPLQVGQRVAVEPSTPCYHCEMCEQGHPNLCPNHTFYGVYPTDGALQECMIVHARNCFPIPESISDGAGTLLETLGVAIHAVDLGKIRVANTVAVIGCGPVGLLILQLLKLMGASTVYAFDKFEWRVEKARELGAVAWNVDQVDALAVLREATHGRGTDVVFEVAWADESVQLAADMVRIGGRVVLVGIPGDDNLRMQHSTARRKGLTIMMARRMKHTYPRAIALASSGRIDLDGLISHHYPLAETAIAFAQNAAYAEGVHKIIVDV